MTSLGIFGAAAREYEPDNADPDTFEFFGETFTVRGQIPSMIQLTVAAALAGKVGGVDGDAAMFDALRHALTVPERTVDGDKAPADASEWERFYRAAIDQNAASELLTLLVLKLMAAEDARPTVRQPTYSSGLSATSTGSNSSASDSPASPA